jgi:hypothetical protein
VDVEHTNVRFLGNLVLNLWDCGGQYRFFESYFENDTIFRNVEVLIYVFGTSTQELHLIEVVCRAYNLSNRACQPLIIDLPCMSSSLQILIRLILRMILLCS